MSIPTNKKLYARVKSEAKQKFKTWPSAYASSWLVKEYKRRGGKYRSKSKRRSRKSTLRRWHREKWVDVCYWPKRVPCGRSKSKRKYPYCRPSKKITSKTPKTVQELTAKQRKSRCRRKRKNPNRKII